MVGWKKDNKIKEIWMDALIKDLFKNYLKIVDNYIVPFLRSQNGMFVIIGIIILLILF